MRFQCHCSWEWTLKLSRDGLSLSLFLCFRSLIIDRPSAPRTVWLELLRELWWKFPRAIRSRTPALDESGTKREAAETFDCYFSLFLSLPLPPLLSVPTPPCSLVNGRAVWRACVKNALFHIESIKKYYNSRSCHRKRVGLSKENRKPK